MEAPESLFVDKFEVPQECAFLHFDLHQAAVSLPFQVHEVYRFWMLVEGRLIALSIACFKFVDEGLEEA